MPHGITQCYLPPGRGDIPALSPAEAGTRLSDPVELTYRADRRQTSAGSTEELLAQMIVTFLRPSLALF